MAESTRVEDLKRRVQLDPASIAFAALAEEYRRAGQYQEAIATCQAGLQRHPAYLSARVTLGRSFLELGRYDEAREQLEHVLRVAPENLAAIRGLAEIHHRKGEIPETVDPRHSAGAAEPPPSGPTAVEPPALQAAVAEPGRPAVAEPSAGEPQKEATPVEPEPVRVTPAPRAPIQLSKVADAAPEAPAVPEPAAPRPVATRPVSPPPMPVAKVARPEPVEPAVSTPAPPPVRRTTPVTAPPPRAAHPDEAALPALEAFLAAIVRVRESKPMDRTSRR